MRKQLHKVASGQQGAIVALMAALVDANETENLAIERAHLAIVRLGLDNGHLALSVLRIRQTAVNWRHEIRNLGDGPFADTIIDS